MDDGYLIEDCRAYVEVELMASRSTGSRIVLAFDHSLSNES